LVSFSSSMVCALVWIAMGILFRAPVQGLRTDGQPCIACACIRRGLR
jgi:hypothetical protein